MFKNNATLVITGMTCAACANRIEKGLNRMDGVTASVNLAMETARVEFVPEEATIADVINKIEHLGYGASLRTENDHSVSGKDFELAFRISDEKTKQPVTDLEPYLGAVGHVVIISEDTKEYLHVHPVDEKAKGPEARFLTQFPSPGLYKVWAQFQRSGQVITVPFVVEAE